MNRLSTDATRTRHRCCPQCITRARAPAHKSQVRGDVFVLSSERREPVRSRRNYTRAGPRNVRARPSVVLRVSRAHSKSFLSTPFAFCARTLCVRRIHGRLRVSPAYNKKRRVSRGKHARCPAATTALVGGEHGRGAICAPGGWSPKRLDRSIDRLMTAVNAARRSCCAARPSSSSSSSSSSGVYGARRYGRTDVRQMLASHYYALPYWGQICRRGFSLRPSKLFQRVVKSTSPPARGDRCSSPPRPTTKTARRLRRLRLRRRPVFALAACCTCNGD